MKRTALITAAILCLVPGVRSHAAGWYWVFFAQPLNRPEAYSSIAFYGTSPNASDNHDDSDQLVLPEIVGAHLGVYHETGVEGWSGPTGFWAVDLQAAIVSPQQLHKVWNFYVWMDPETPGFLPTITLKGYGANPPPPFTKVTMQFIRNAIGAPVNPHVGATWDLSAYPWGGASEQIFAVLPAYRTDDGRNGYLFRMTAEVIPEPSSLLIMAAGFISAGGALRRSRLK